MNSVVEEIFKNTPLGINSVMKAAVTLAEQVDTRKDISGKEKTALVVSTLKEVIGEGSPELVALVEGVIPGMLELIISTAKGEFKLKQVTSCIPALAPVAVAAVSKSRLWDCLRSASSPAAKPTAATAATAATASTAATEVVLRDVKN
jgi:hypothetical protein